ncbi:MAG: DUF86 domain-containing protein [SAR324 cluster bacterium]|nr:DUF86 domain-containing protein [SAR324 cluster bacterium]
MKDPFIYLTDILQAIQQINDYTNGIEYQEFEKDTKTQDAVIRQITIIGEASSRLDYNIKEAISPVPWKQIIGMRNKLVHDYAGVLADRIWEVVQKDLKPLRKAIESFIDESSNEEQKNK